MMLITTKYKNNITTYCGQITFNMRKKNHTHTQFLVPWPWRLVDNWGNIALFSERQFSVHIISKVTIKYDPTEWSYAIRNSVTL